MAYITWRKCDCDNGYRGPYGYTCSACEGGGMVETIVREEGDCPSCDGSGEIARRMSLHPCPKGCGVKTLRHVDDDL